MSLATVKRIDADLNISEEINPELVYLWQQVAIGSEYITYPYESSVEFLGTNGRMKFISPVFAAINEKNHTAAVDIFHQYENFYHKIAINKVKSTIGLETEPVYSSMVTMSE